MSVATVAALAVVAQVAVHGEQARACIWEPKDVDNVVFDFGVLGTDPTGLKMDTSDESYGSPCFTCAPAAMLDDWAGYLAKTGITRADLQLVLETATAVDLEAMAKKLGGKSAKIAPAFAKLGFWSATAEAKATLVKAMTELGLARRLEPFTNIDPYSDTAAVKPPAGLLAEATAARKAAGADAFLAQRYGYLELRALFYQNDWPAVVKLFDGTPALAAPSIDLANRARYYVAGALKHQANLGRANLELARLSEYPPLATFVSTDFKPMEERDWKQTLKLAKTPHEQALVWRLVGIQHDGLRAAQTIQKLEPTSTALPLLLVRELARVEPITTDVYGVDYGEVDPDYKPDLAGQAKALAAIEKLATTALATPNADRPWVMELVLAEIHAIRGEIVLTRPHAARAIQLHPGDQIVANQANRSLALALANRWTISSANEAEIAAAAAGVTTWATSAAEQLVRRALAKAYLAAGKRVEAEFLIPVDLYNQNVAYGPLYAQPNGVWDGAFLEKMRARSATAKTPWERFVVSGSYPLDEIEREIAKRKIVDGDLAGAQQAFVTYKLKGIPLHFDPFVNYVRDCVECDAEKTAKAKWTDASLVAELAKQATIANGTGEAAANAALKICKALFNVSGDGLGNVFWYSTHQQSTETYGGEAWCKRALTLSKNRETKAQAAWFGAKAERGAMEAKATSPDYAAMVTPTTWYPIMQTLQDTKYGKEALKQCGWFATWTSANRKP